MRLPSIAFALTVLLAASAARADSTVDKASRAAQLKREGNEAMVSMRYADALAKYEEANRLAPHDASILYNLGRAHQLLGNSAEALDALERFAELSPAMRKTIPSFDALLEDVRAHVAIVNVSCEPVVERALVLVNDKVVAERCASMQLRVPSGRARVR